MLKRNTGLRVLYCDLCENAIVGFTNYYLHDIFINKAWEIGISEETMFIVCNSCHKKIMNKEIECPTTKYDVQTVDEKLKSLPKRFNKLINSLKELI